MARFRFFLRGSLLVVSLLSLTGFARAQAEPLPPLPTPVTDPLGLDDPDIFGLAKLKILEKPKDELEALKAERYLAAWENLKFLLPRFQEQDAELPEFVRAALLVIDCQLAITKSEADRLRLMEQSAEFWKQIEGFERVKFQEGTGRRSDYSVAKVHHLSARIAVLEFQKAMKEKKTAEPSVSASVSPPSVPYIVPVRATYDACPDSGGRILRRRRW